MCGATSFDGCCRDLPCDSLLWPSSVNFGRGSYGDSSLLSFRFQPRFWPSELLPFTSIFEDAPRVMVDWPFEALVVMARPYCLLAVVDQPFEALVVMAWPYCLLAVVDRPFEALVVMAQPCCCLAVVDRPLVAAYYGGSTLLV